LQVVPIRVGVFACAIRAALEDRSKPCIHGRRFAGTTGSIDCGIVRTSICCCSVLIEGPIGLCRSVDVAGGSPGDGRVLTTSIDVAGGSRVDGRVLTTPVDVAGRLRSACSIVTAIDAGRRLVVRDRETGVHVLDERGLCRTARYAQDGDAAADSKW